MGRPKGQKNKISSTVVTPTGSIERGVLPDTLGKNNDEQMAAIKLRAEKVKELSDKLRLANDRNETLSNELSALQIKFDDLDRRYRKVVKAQ